MLKGFRRKEFRGKLAIGITVNFVNKNTQEEAAIEEISGVAFIYNQQFFQELKDKTQIDLENIVYYKDDTHYFVMTAKKKSLLQKGVIKEVSYHPSFSPHNKGRCPLFLLFYIFDNAALCIIVKDFHLPCSIFSPSIFGFSSSSSNILEQKVET